MFQRSRYGAVGNDNERLIILQHPVGEKWPITCPYGKKGEMWKGGIHKGVDFGTPEGTPCYAAADGTVQLQGFGGAFGSRIWIVSEEIRHLYAHLSLSMVEVGQNVKRGEKIGLTGNTGNSSGAHIHFEVRRLEDDEPIPPVFA